MRRVEQNCRGHCTVKERGRNTPMNRSQGVVVIFRRIEFEDHTAHFYFREFVAKEHGHRGRLDFAVPYGAQVVKSTDGHCIASANPGSSQVTVRMRLDSLLFTDMKASMKKTECFGFIDSSAEGQARS